MKYKSFNNNKITDKTLIINNINVSSLIIFIYSKNLKYNQIKYYKKINLYS